MFNSAFATTQSHKSPRLYCDRLDTIYELSALVDLTHSICYAQGICGSVSCELATELWRSLIISIKEFLIAKVYTLNHILQARQQTPMCKARCPFQRQMVNHCELTRILIESLVVSLMQVNEMIIHASKGLYLYGYTYCGHSDYTSYSIV